MPKGTFQGTSLSSEREHDESDVNLRVTTEWNSAFSLPLPMYSFVATENVSTFRMRQTTPGPPRARLIIREGGALGAEPGAVVSR
jgi:hypothetical protein